MKAKQTLKLDMFDKVQRTLDENSAVWSGVEKLNNAVALFREINKLLNELKVKHEKDLLPIVESKAAARTSLINTTVPVLSVVQAFAHEKDDRDLL